MRFVSPGPWNPMQQIRWQITNANLVTMTRTGVLKASGLIINGGTIERILEPGESEPDLLTINMNGMSLYPGLINAHDSLLGTYDRFRGENWPYINWLSWDNDLKTSGLFRERMILDVELLYNLGALKNIINGSTTVVDFIPEFVRKPFENSLPISLYSNFGMEHSMESYSPSWGEGIEAELKKSRENNTVFMVQIAEGFDRECRQSLTRLEHQGGLTNHTACIHGLSLSGEDLKRIHSAGASLIWTPVSNHFLYNAMPPVEQAMEMGIPVLIGSDNAMSGSPGLLADLKTASRYLQDKNFTGGTDEQLAHMVTEKAATVLQLSDRGSIAPGNRADLLVATPRHRDPYTNLIALEPEGIFLVLHQGYPILGEPQLGKLFEGLGVEYNFFQLNGKEKISSIEISGILGRTNASLGLNKTFDFIPVDLNLSDIR